jgi:bla regulator protein BlaR1
VISLQDFLRIFITLSLSMSLIALAFILLNPILSKKYSAKCRYFAGLIVLIGLIIPFRPQIGFAVFNLSSPNTYQSVAKIYESSNSSSNNITLTTQTNVQGIQPVVLPKSFNFFSSLSLNDILVFLWALGVLISILYRIISYYRFNRLIKRWNRPYKENRAIEIMQQLYREIDIRRRIDIRICPQQLISTPILKGLIKPVILLPDIELTDNELYLVLKHELVHYKHKDLYLKLIIMIAMSLHWFNPIVYFLSKSLSSLCEQACDEAVLNKVNYEQRMLYSQTLITVSARRSKLINALSTNFYGGKEDMKKRLSFVFDVKNKRKGIIILMSLFLITAMSGTVIAITEDNTSSKALAATNSTVQANQDVSKPTVAEDAEKKFVEPDPTPGPDGRYAYPDYLEPGEKVMYGEQDSRRLYLKYGTEFDTETGLWSYQGKPILFFEDGIGGFSGGTRDVIENGIGIKVIRAEDGKFIKFEILSSKEILEGFEKAMSVTDGGCFAKAYWAYLKQTLNDRIAAEVK